MTRMSREFTLVLLGASTLTAGYFLNRGNDKLLANEDGQADKRVAGSHHSGAHIVYLHRVPNGGRGVSTAMASSVARGGFGGIGAHTGGG